LPKQPRLTADEADRLLLQAGFALLRTKGSHRIYGRGAERIVVPSHAGKVLHPKIVRQVLDAAGG
jgi:predicted RNA binding protein YcfA (HicA-like mRNA interferase family)